MKVHYKIRPDMVRIVKNYGTPANVLKLIDIDEYYILKVSHHFRFVPIDELLNMKYAKYILLKKAVYKKHDIQIWFDFIKENKIRFRFLNKPFPSIEILKLIDII